MDWCLSSNSSSNMKLSFFKPSIKTCSINLLCWRIYVSNSLNGLVLKYAANGPSYTQIDVLGSGFGSPTGTAVDSTGVDYVVDELVDRRLGSRSMRREELIDERPETRRGLHRALVQDVAEPG